MLAQIRDEHEIVGKVESWRELTKLKNTYLDSLPELIREDGRIHTTFNQVTAATGRLSSTNPNLQNIPIRSELGRPVRACFVTEPGWRLLSCDYNQVELRVLAHVAGEDVLREIFASGEDVHAETAAEVLNIDRVRGRPGGALEGEDGQLRDRLRPLRLRARRPPADLARGGRRLHRPLLRAFPRGQDSSSTRRSRSAESEGLVKTLMGRRRLVPELRSSNRQRRMLGERLAVNTVIQGTAADIIKVAMVRCHDALADAGMETRLILQIHDELLFEGPEAEMEAAAEARRQGDVRRVRPRPAARRGRRHRRGLAGGEVVDRGRRSRPDRRRGRLIALQPAINAGLGKETGNLAAALVSFGVGTILLAVIVALAGQADGIGSLTNVPWYYLLGGVLGAAYVTTALITVSRSGPAASPPRRSPASSPPRS